MKSVFCSQCGQELPVTKKALPRYSRVIALIDPHECTEVVTPNWEPSPAPLPSSGDQKFVEKLNELDPPKELTIDPGDRRDASVIKDANFAPKGIRQFLKTNY